MLFVRLRRCVRFDCRFPFLALGVFSFTLSLPMVAAWAQSLQEEGLEQQGLGTVATMDNWNVSLGLGLAIKPKFPGAGDYHARPIPFVSIIYGDPFFLGPSGLGMNVIDWNGLRAGPVIGFLGGRNQDDDPHLNGLGNISASITAGLFANYRLGPIEIAGTVRQAVTHSNNGLLGLVRVDYHIPALPQDWEATIGPDLEFANVRYDETWFGVSQDQSVQSGLSPYNSGAGVKDVGLHANLTYFYSENILLRMFASIEQLTGDDANSPIVQNKMQSLIGFGVAYHF